MSHFGSVSQKGFGSKARATFFQIGVGNVAVRPAKIVALKFIGEWKSALNMKRLGADLERRIFQGGR